MEPKLDSDVRALLANRRGDWAQIAKAADVSHSWISKFVNGHIKNPGYATLTRLYTHMTKPATGVGAGH